MMKWLGMGLAAVGLAIGVGATPAEAQKHDRSLLLPDEIAQKKDVTNAYEAIQRFRSQWLRTSRSKGSLGAGASATEGYRYKSQKPSSSDGSTDTGSDPATPSTGFDPTATDKSASSPVLYIDDVKQDQLDELRNVRVDEIAQIRYMTGTEATGRYGSGHDAGAILLKTTRVNH